MMRAKAKQTQACERFCKVREQETLTVPNKVTALPFVISIVEKRNVECCGIPLKPTEGSTPISCHALLDRPACAPFSKERCMECINATSLHRKSGPWGHPAFVAGEDYTERNSDLDVGTFISSMCFL
jgi:hypothetical protein